MSRVCIFLAEGFEEVEALTVVDMLRRAGIDIRMISITGKETVTSSHNVTVQADGLFESENFDDTEMLVLPGGMPGTANLKAYEPLSGLLLDFYEKGKKLAAICAAPSVLGGLGILKGKTACSFPTFEDQLAGAKVTDSRVEVCGNIITSRGMGTAISFGAAVIEMLEGRQAAEEVKEKIVYGYDR